ncbi:hypothetical protein GCM10009786_11600 [Leucobacter alluvii]|uniref:(S)-ureidoglycine aminohydrolase cupin domain-containing protein n=1 Tax=Leucobacter alluvii TaxID=340321 RepID=A0ABN3B615_9MICO
MYSIQGITAELKAAGTEQNVISGECKNSLLEMAQSPHMAFGIWEGTRGTWRSTWESWEFFTVLSGSGTLTDGEGHVHELVAGASVWIAEGSTGVWKVEKTLRKSYVIPVEESK